MFFHRKMAANVGALPENARKWLLKCLLHDEDTDKDVAMEVALAKLALLQNNAMALLGSVVWGAMFYAYNAVWCGHFHAMTLVFTIIFLVAALKVKGAKWVAVFGSLQCYVWTFFVFGIYFCMGPNSDNFMMNQAVMAPTTLLAQQFKGQAVALALVIGASTIAMQVVIQSLGPDISPQEHVLLPAWLFVTYKVSNVIVPMMVILGHMEHYQTIVKEHQDNLNQTLTSAKVVCRGLVKFDLENLQPPPETSSTGETTSENILHMLYDVVVKMRLYRPFLPHYLLGDPKGPEQKYGQDGRLQVPSARSRHSRRSSRSQATAIVNSVSQSSSRSRQSGPDLEPVARSHGHQLSLSTGLLHELPIRMRPGSVLLIGFSGMDRLLERHLDECRQASLVSRLFCQKVVHAVQDSNGVVLSLAGDQCVAVWNLLSSCRSHVTRALDAACSIQGSVQPLIDSVSCRLSISVWAGDIPSGSFGTNDTLMFGVFECALAPAVALQRYGAATSRCIMVSSQVWEANRQSPTHHLLPVDVLDLHVADQTSLGLVPRGEVVCECLGNLEGAQGEWMYQLDAASSALEGERCLHEVLSMMRQGHSDLESMQNILSSAVAKGCQKVREVSNFVHSILQPGRAYCNVPGPIWGGRRCRRSPKSSPHDTNSTSSLESNLVWAPDLA